MGEQFSAPSHSVAPRLGLAWDPTGKGKTSVRAGWGMFYEQLDADYRFFAALQPPFILRLDWERAQVPDFPHPFASPKYDVSNVPVTARAIDPNMVPNTVFQYNFTLERELSPNTLVRAGYVGRHAYHLTNNLEANNRLARFDANGRKYFSTQDSRTANPILGPVPWRESVFMPPTPFQNP